MSAGWARRTISTSRLPRATAAYLTLRNGRLSAAECLQQGIVNRVVPKDRLIPAAEELAEMVCESSPRAVQAAGAALSPERRVPGRR